MKFGISDLFSQKSFSLGTEFGFSKYCDSETCICLNDKISYTS